MYSTPSKSYNLIKYIVLVLLLIFNSDQLPGQYSGLDLLDGKKKKTIDIKVINGFIIAEIIYAGILKMNFIVDTGASNNILFNKYANDILGIEYTDTVKIIGADLTGELTAYVSRNIPISLTNTNQIYRDIIVLKEDYLDISVILGEQVDGMLGGDFFKGLALGFNFDKNTMTIYDPRYFTKPKKFYQTTIDIHKYKPYLMATTIVDSKIDTLRYLIDTGASVPLIIHNNKDKNITLPDNVILGSLGRGLTGDLTGYVGQIKKLIIDPFEFTNVIASFQKIDSLVIDKNKIYRDGLIGYDILSRFNLIIDYTTNQLYYKPSKKIAQKFNYDKSGLLIYAMGEKHNEYIIKNVYPGTPAYEAGIKPGDKILKI